MNISAINTDEDHIHIMFEAYSNLNLSKFIGEYKAASSKAIRLKFENFLSQYYWKPYFYSNSYFVCSISEHSSVLVETYIRNQGKK